MRICICIKIGTLHDKGPDVNRHIEKNPLQKLSTTLKTHGEQLEKQDGIGYIYVYICTIYIHICAQQCTYARMHV